MVSLQYLGIVVAFASFQTAVGLELSVGFDTAFSNQSVSLTWILSPGDPSTFNVNALCKNVTVPLRTAVLGGDKHVTISLSQLMSQLPPPVRKAYASCTLRATDTSNKTTLASSPSFFVLSADVPTDSSSPALGPTPTSSILSPTFSSSITGPTTDNSMSPTTVPSASSASENSTFVQGSDTLISATILEQLTTELGPPGQETAVQTTTDSLGNVWTITPGISATSGGVAPPGFTQIERTTTITFPFRSSTSVTTLTFTTNIPIQSAGLLPGSSSGPSAMNHTQIAAIIGGVLGSLAALALVVCACVLRRRRRDPRPSILEPLIHDPSYRQPTEKSVRIAEATRQPGDVATQQTIPSSTQVDLESGSSIIPESSEVLIQDVLNARRLRLQVQRMSERILELEDQHREIFYSAQWAHPSSDDIGPPDYADTDSYTYSERMTHD